MIKFVKDLFLGEPVMFTGLVSTGLTAALAALMDPPIWLAIGTPIWVAASAFYARAQSDPTHPSPLSKK